MIFHLEEVPLVKKNIVRPIIPENALPRWVRILNEMLKEASKPEPR